MIRKLAPVALALALSAGLGSAAIAQAPAPAAAAAKFSSSTTPLAELMKNPQTKPILQKHLTGIFSQIEDNIDMIPPEFTLEALAQYASLDAAVLKAIDADLAKL